MNADRCGSTALNINPIFYAVRDCEETKKGFLPDWSASLSISRHLVSKGTVPCSERLVSPPTRCSSFSASPRSRSKSFSVRDFLDPSLCPSPAAGSSIGRITAGAASDLDPPIPPSTMELETKADGTDCL